MTRWLTVTFFALALVIAAGCAKLDEKQRQWIFQPSDRSWSSAGLADDIQDVWVEFDSHVTGQRAKLHALWLPSLPATATGTAAIATLAALPATGSLPAANTLITSMQQLATDSADGHAGPVLLYLHGARWAVNGSAMRIRRMQEMGFSVLAIDYRGFGKSSTALPSEATAAEDARAAWAWIKARHPNQPRYIFGHSLGGAIAIDLASSVDDESGLMVENTFTSIADVVSTFKWGWLPFSMLVTQRFDSLRKIADIGSPLIVVHGSNDALIPSALGRRLFDAATTPKKFLLVDGGSHYNTNDVAQPLYVRAIRDLFKIDPPAAPRAVALHAPGPALKMPARAAADTDAPAAQVPSFAPVRSAAPVSFLR